MSTTEKRRDQRSGKRAPAYRWSKTPDTQHHILRAARQVFSERGYTNASVAMVVERSGRSVGSIYHHFGSKLDLFDALWNEFRGRRMVTMANATRGVDRSDRYAAILAGARVYLEFGWDERELCRIFFGDDVPPEFAATIRDTADDWREINERSIGADTERDRMIVVMLGSFLFNALKDVCASPTAAIARERIDAALEVLTDTTTSVKVSAELG